MAAISSYPISPTHNLLAPVRAPRVRVIAPSADVAKPTSAQLTEASAVIAQTGWLEMLEPLMPHALRRARGKHLGGRKPEMTLKALLTGCLLLAIMERPILIKDVWRLLAFGIDAGSRKHLGLNPKREIIERMVSRAFGLVAATINSSIHAESNAPLFDPENVKKLLGLDPDDLLTGEDHQNFIDQVLGENEIRLDAFIRGGLRATHPTDAEHEGDYALDGSYISSWEAPNRSRRRTTYIDKNGEKQRRSVNPEEMSDPDATWWSKKSGPIASRGRLAGSNDSGLGYLITAVTWVEKDFGPNKRGADIPYLIDHLSVKTANTIGHREGSRVIESMISHHEREDAAAKKCDRVRGDILADREYSNTVAWLKSMHAVGLTPHFMLHKDQTGHTRTLATGPIIVDGIPYSPGMPEVLRLSMGPALFATRDDRSVKAAHNLHRKPYRIRAYGNSRQDDGSLKFYCPASNLAKASINCANKPSSKRGSTTRIQIGTAMPVIVNSPMPAICAQSSVTVPFDEVPFWQPHIPGTPEHQWSINRRNLIESTFSKIKDEATQSVRRGTFRVMGRAKVSMAVLFNAMASNLVEVQRWRLRKAGVRSLDAMREKVARTPRHHTRARIVAANKREEAARARAARVLLEELGAVVNLGTGEILESSSPPTPLP
ncbi:MAG: hypothetical protein DM484_02425 [Candidatus Methylumidiphilus alinenensis]|uniref:Uncharacterized protein n=1 Tax=Candidatus Methylumidiphilus alinenensis TaxID=2202197 RepID=A0A2W4RP30_9GAMM|nr:MAG: hypothetical protein DM484_02425 [Candidatus Methylumidiphilus alinenensis]